MYIMHIFLHRFFFFFTCDVYLHPFTGPQWTHCTVLSCLFSFPLSPPLFTFLAATYSIASHCISLTVLMSHLFPLPRCLFFVPRSVVAPGNAPLGVRVEPLSSKSVRVKWKVRKKVKRKSVLSSPLLVHLWPSPRPPLWPSSASPVFVCVSVCEDACEYKLAVSINTHCVSCALCCVSLFS